MHRQSKKRRSVVYFTLAALAALPLTHSIAWGAGSDAAASAPAEGPAKPAGAQSAEAASHSRTTAPIRSVTVIHPRLENWPEVIEASGNVMPWQESRVASEVGGLRLANVLVGVGEWVKKGQVLAQLDAATVEADLDAANAQLVEAEAGLAQATATLGRGKRLAPMGGVSQQDLMLYETQQHTAEARVNAAKAQVRRAKLKLNYATLVAPDDGVISSSSASEGMIVQSGSELFRLIRQGRLEWRAEVKGETLLRLVPGQEVTVKSPLGPEVKGKVRLLSPTIDIVTRNGLAYVDLPSGTNLKAGLTVDGSISMGKRRALVLPASAILREQGAAKVFVLTSEGKIAATAVKTGRIKDDSIEVLAGLDERDQVIADDPASLKIGEVVKPGTVLAGSRP